MSVSIVTTVPFSVNGEESSDNTTETVKEETKTLNVGDIIEFGSYPQKRVLDTELISKLNAIDAPLISYGYVSNNGDVKISYADVTYNGAKYRKVYAEEPLPYRYGESAGDYGGYISSSRTYKVGEVYWFMYEPIHWKVLSNDSDGVTVLAERNLDTSMYNRINASQSWNESYLHNWLNEKFYSTAFSDDEKSAINSTKHYNSVNQTGNEDNDVSTDKLWIPTSAEYDNFTIDNTISTAYARCNGYNSDSWINTIDNRGFIRYKNKHKSYDSYEYSLPTEYGVGVRPMMALSKDSKVVVSEKYKPTETKKYYAGNYAYTLDENNEAYLVEAFGEEESITLPEKLDGKTVVGISEDIFQYNSNIKELTIPDNYKKISCKFKSKTLETVHIGSGVSEINKFAFTFAPNMQNVFVSKDNKTYKDIDGVLCNGGSILYYPIGRKDKSYTIPESIGTVKDGAGFLNAIYLEKLYCPNGFYADYNERSIGYSKEDSYDYYQVTKNPNFVIYGYHGTSIHKYANHCYIPFVDVNTGKTYEPNPQYDLYNYTVLSDGTVKIKNYYMNYYSKIKTLNVLPEIYGYKVSQIDQYFLNYNNYQHYNIEKIVLPDAIHYIPPYTFKGSQYLKEIEFSENMRDIGAEAFSGCTSLKKISKLNKINIIEDSVFYNCKSLEEINIPNGVTSIGEEAFYNCKSLKEINLPETVDTIYEYAFEGCESVEKFNIPKAVKELDFGLFKGCKSLKSMVIDDNITYLGDELFNDCTSLEEVYIPSTITDFDKDIFDNCSSLGGIYIDSGNPSYSDINGILVNKEKTKLICYPSGRTSKTYTVPNGITTFENGAFARANNLEKVIFQDGVESLSYELFYNNKGIKTVEFSDSIKNIGSRAFVGCTSLEEITVPDSVSNLGTGVFTDCSSLKKAVIPYSVKTLPSKTFLNCTSLDDVTLENVKIIGSYAFRNTALSSMTFDATVEKINKYAFADCKNFDEVTIKNRNATIDSKAFGYFYYSEYGYRREGMIGITGYRGSTAEALAHNGEKFWFYDIEAQTTTTPSTSTTTTPTVVKPTKLTLNKKRVVLTKYSRNTGTKLNATVTPTNATNKSVIWKSSNSKVAKVDSKGNVTTVSKGTCIITAISTVDSKVKATCKVTVVQKVVSVKLSAKSKTIKKCKSFTLKATVLPTNANMKAVTFTSTNKKVATVNSKGKVTAKKVGKTTIIVTTKDSKKQAKCTLKVK